MSRRPQVHMAVAVTAVRGENDGLILRCIASLFETSVDAPYEVRVTAVDNSPGLGMARLLRERFPAIEVIENRSPRGFAANQNAALAGSNADYLLIANDDVVFLPGALERAVRYLEAPAHAKVAVAGFKLLNSDGSLQRSTYGFPTVFSAVLSISGFRELVPFARWTERLARFARGDGRSRFWAHDRTVEVESFTGALALVRGAAAREVGPMDEVSLIGGEETEWHKRFWDHGWSIVYLHDAAVIHLGSQTMATLPGLRAESLKGLLHYFRKHRPGLPYWTLRALTMGVLLVRAGSSLFSREPRARALSRDLLRTAWRWRGDAAPSAQPE